MSKPHVYVTRMIPPESLKLLQEHCNTTIWEGENPPPREELLKQAAQSDAILSMLTEKIDADLMDAAPNLKVISNFAVGYDNIDIAAATERGIPVGHTPGVLTESCADYTFAMLLAAARRLSEAEQYVKDGEWKTWFPMQLLGFDVHNATLGILGLGRIGQAVARRAKGFNMRILYHGGSNKAAAAEIGAEEVSLDELLRESDFVSIHMPLKPETHHFISTRELGLMKSSAVLLNTARGAVVDSDALYTALSEKQIFAAALDVTDPEPIPPEHPLVHLENCLVLPHIASATMATREHIGKIAVENLLAGLKGESLVHCVNPDVQN
ncbi:MAG: 2-hydroxyacid dehydrogenase [Aggregatilineales bacterium]